MITIPEPPLPAVPFHECPPPPPPEVAVVEDAGGLEPWQLALIIAGSATVTLAAVVQQIMIKRKRMGSVMDDSNKSSGYAVKP